MNDLYSIKAEILSANNSSFFLMENANYSFLGLKISDDTIFTVVVTIGIFVFGILIERFISLYKQFQEKREIVDIVWMNLKKTIHNALPKVKDMYKTRIELISLKTGILSSSDKLIAEEVFVPLSLNYQLLFKAFTDKNTVIGIVNCTKLIQEVFSNIDAEHREVYKETNIIEKQISLELGKLFSLLDEYINIGQDKNWHMSDKRFQMIYEINKSFDRSLGGHKNIEYLKNEFLISLYEQFKIDNYFNKDRDVFRIFTSVKEILVLIIRIENNQKTLKDAYCKYIGNISEAEERLSKHLKSIEKDEPKCFWKYLLIQMKPSSAKS